MRRFAFEEGAEAPMLAKKYKEVAFPEAEDEKKERIRAQLLGAARRLVALLGEDELPVPKAMAKRTEDAVNELLGALEAN